MESNSRLLPSPTVEEYRQNGFVKIPQLISSEEAKTFREEGLSVINKITPHGDDEYNRRLNQHVNIWQTNNILKQLSHSKAIASIAEQLVGKPLLLWHDHLLSKGPNNDLATEWHQDQPYWPFKGQPQTTSVWIALQDTPEELGCMNYIAGSHHLNSLGSTNLGTSRGLYNVAPHLEFEPKVKIPLKAGDAVFHNGFCAHMATANQLDEWRIAHVIAYTEASTVLANEHHIVLNRLGEESPKTGETLNHPTFPRVAKEGVS